LSLAGDDDTTHLAEHEGGSGGTSTVPAGVARDRLRALTAVLGFSFSLGIGNLALPLLALAAGYDAVTVGLLTATSAISQFVLRLQLPMILGRVPDRILIVGACLMLGSSYGLLILSTALPIFVIAQLLQGGARALFWTASQTHAARSAGIPVRMIAQVSAVGNIGSMSGPAVTGVLAATSLQLALLVGLASAVLGAIVGVTLARLDPYVRRSRLGEARLWRQPGVDVACWASFTGGGWRALMNSYVPVLLTSAGMPPNAIGWILSGADGAATIAITALVRLPPRLTRPSLPIAVVVAGLPLAILPFVAFHPVWAGAIVILSGIGSGLVMTLGVAVARELSHPGDEGEVIALAGTFRAAALLVTPTAVALSVAAVGVGAALSVAGIAIALPATWLSLRRRL
jgi:predicted MFS family arabinose efflux permease